MYDKFDGCINFFWRRVSGSAVDNEIIFLKNYKIVWELRTHFSQLNHADIDIVGEN